MKRVFLDAGHYVNDSGAIAGGIKLGDKENKLTIELRDKVFDLLKNYDVEVIVVPDNLNLKQSIDWVNTQARIEDIAVSVHFNTNSNSIVSGTEAYYSNDREREIAIIFSDAVSKSLGIKNRGALHDSLTWVGSLGWLRHLICDSVLVEVCYLSSPQDREVYNADKAAGGIVSAITKTMNIQNLLPNCEKLAVEVGSLKKLVDALIAFIAKYLK